MGSFRITRHHSALPSKREWMGLCLGCFPCDLLFFFFLVRKRFGDRKRYLSLRANMQNSHREGRERRQCFIRADKWSIVSVSWQNWFGFCFYQYDLTLLPQIFVILGFSSKGKQWTKFRNLIPYVCHCSIETVVMLCACSFCFADTK